MTHADPRLIALRARGRPHGPITRLFSPGDAGEYIKPFVFLDYFECDPVAAPSFGFHPHSGIATLTLVLAGQISYQETTGREGDVDAGGVEWMRAGGGVWHTGGMSGRALTKGFQLWVALPPKLELAPAESQYLAASNFAFAGPARVVAGEYEGVASPLGAPAGLTFLDVRLKAGQQWRFIPPDGHDVAWIASHEGLLSAPPRVAAGEAIVFELGPQPIVFEAITEAGFILGSAIRHPHDLVTGHYSVHTTPEALRQGEFNIATIGQRLHDQGVLAAARRGGP